MIAPDKPLSARRERTRQRLLDASRQVFRTVGFQASSVEEICEAAGFTRGAFYSNFDSKDELMFELASAYADEFVRWLSERTPPTSAGLRADVEALIADLANAQGLLAEWYTVTVEFELHVLRHPSMRERWVQQQSMLRAALASTVEDMLRRSGGQLLVPTATFVDAALSLARSRVAAQLLGRVDEGPDTLTTLTSLLIANHEK